MSPEERDINDEKNSDGQIELSVVIPVFNASATLEELVESVISVTQKARLSAEIIAVDDCSSDDSADILKRLHSSFPELRSFRLTKNSGQSDASMAGIYQSRGKYIVTMDDDLQYNPADILRLYELIRSGNYDMVCGCPLRKQHKGYYGWVSNRSASLLQRLFLPRQKGVALNSSFKMYKRKLFFRKDDSKTGYHIHHLWKHERGSCASLVVEHHVRKHGKSGYNFFKYLRHYKVMLWFMIRQISAWMAVLSLIPLMIAWLYFPRLVLPFAILYLFFSFLCALAFFALRRTSKVNFLMKELK